MYCLEALTALPESWKCCAFTEVVRGLKMSAFYEHTCRLCSHNELRWSVLRPNSASVTHRNAVLSPYKLSMVLSLLLIQTDLIHLYHPDDHWNECRAVEKQFGHMNFSDGCWFVVVAVDQYRKQDHGDDGEDQDEDAEKEALVGFGAVYWIMMRWPAVCSERVSSR